MAILLDQELVLALCSVAKSCCQDRGSTHLERLCAKFLARSNLGNLLNPSHHSGCSLPLPTTGTAVAANRFVRCSPAKA